MEEDPAMIGRLRTLKNGHPVECILGDDLRWSSDLDGFAALPRRP